MMTSLLPPFLLFDSSVTTRNLSNKGIQSQQDKFKLGERLLKIIAIRSSVVFFSYHLCFRNCCLKHFGLRALQGPTLDPHSASDTILQLRTQILSPQILALLMQFIFPPIIDSGVSWPASVLLCKSSSSELTRSVTLSIMGTRNVDICSCILKA